MGIESDQLVFDYLSRVGDLAQQRQLPSGSRMRLVTELRAEIDRRRAKSSGDNPAAVRRILARLGSPDEVVSAAGEGARRSAERPEHDGGAAAKAWRDGREDSHAGGESRAGRREPSSGADRRPSGERDSRSAGRRRTDGRGPWQRHDAATAGPKIPPGRPEAPSEGQAPDSDTGVPHSWRQTGPAWPGARESEPADGTGPDASGSGHRDGPEPSARDHGAGRDPADHEDTAGPEPSHRGPAVGRAGHLPAQRGAGRKSRVGRLRRAIPRPRHSEPAEPSGADAPDDDAWRRDAPSPPHLAGMDELGPKGSQPDWWRIDGGPLGGTDMVRGFTGGVEIPEILKPPPPKDRTQDAPDGAGKDSPSSATEKTDGPKDDPAGTAAEPARPRRPLLRPWATARKRTVRWSNPLLLLAVALLIAGAVLGNWFALGLGWVIAYASRRLTAAESKWTVLGLPGLAAAAGIAWLWGRMDGRWGEPIAEHHMGDAIAETWPWVVRGAAVASALFLLWRSQRVRP